MNNAPGFANNGASGYLSRNALVVLILCLSVLITYANSFRDGFVEDDHYTIELNRDTLSLQGMATAFTSEDKLVNNSIIPYYRPLTRFSFLFDQHFFGLNPVGYHSVNILLHALCVVLLFFTLIRFDCGFTVSFGVSLIFGVHPVNAETVNFISGRNNILATLFSLASTLAFMNSDATGRVRGYVLSGFLFFLGILSKETALMLLPFLIFLKIYNERPWRDRDSFWKWDTRFIIFHVLFFGIYLLLRLYAIDSSPLQVAGLVGRLRDLLYIIPEYFRLAVIPGGLSLTHIVPADYRAILVPLLIKWVVLLAFLLYLLRNRNRITDLGLAWLIINSIPISNLVKIPSASIAERYLYLPIIGFLIIAADALMRLRTEKGSNKVPFLVFSLLSVVLGVVTFNRNSDWRDDLSLSKSTLVSNPADALAHFDYGYESYVHGDRSTAREEFVRALKLDPHLRQSSWISYYLGAISMESHDRENAERYLLDATRFDPRNSAAQYGLATLLANRDDKTAFSAYGKFLAVVELPSYYLLPEVTGKVTERTNHQKAVTGRFPPPAGNTPSSGTWHFIHRYLSGTELYYDSSTLLMKQEKDKILSFTVKQLLTKTDRRVYSLRLIRFPLLDAAEARFRFDLICSRHLINMTSMEFRDNDGQVIGTIWPEKEYSGMDDGVAVYEYLWPNTIMRSFTDHICVNL